MISEIILGCLYLSFLLGTIYCLSRMVKQNKNNIRKEDICFVSDEEVNGKAKRLFLLKEKELPPFEEQLYALAISDPYVFGIKNDIFKCSGGGEVLFSDLFDINSDSYINSELYSRLESIERYRYIKTILFALNKFSKRDSLNKDAFYAWVERLVSIDPILVSTLFKEQFSYQS